MYFNGMHAHLQEFQRKYREVAIMDMEQLIAVFIHTYVTHHRWPSLKSKLVCRGQVPVLSYGLEGKAIIITILWPAEILVVSIEC